jgi:hypothetical protein
MVLFTLTTYTHAVVTFHIIILYPGCVGLVFFCPSTFFIVTAVAITIISIFIITEKQYHYDLSEVSK